MYRAVVFACALLIRAVSGADEDAAAVNLTAVVNCTSSYSVIPTMQKCLDLYNVTLPLPDPARVTNGPTTAIQAFVTMGQLQDSNTTTRLCRPENIDNYIQASICLNYILGKCAEGVTVGTASEQRQQVTSQCQQVGEYNGECAAAKVLDIQNCANISELFMAATIDTDMSQLMCATQALGRVCGTKHLKSCGERTVEIYLERTPLQDNCKNYTVVYGQGEAVVNLSGVVNCSNPYNIIPTMQKCLDLYDLNLTLPDPARLDNSSTATEAYFAMARLQDTNNTTYAGCSAKIVLETGPDGPVSKAIFALRPTQENIDRYIKASICTNFINKKCAEGNPVRSSAVPTITEVEQRARQNCQQIGEFNRECALAKLEELQGCANASGIIESFTADLDTDIEDFMSQLTCATNEIGRVCGRKHLKSCGERTVEIYLEGQPKLDACKKFTGCSSDLGVRLRYITCQVNSGIIIPLPLGNTSEELGQYILNKVTLDDSKEMCKKQSQASDLISCTLSAQRECSSNNLKLKVPNIQSVQRGFQELCRKIDDFDVECVSNTNKTACKDRNHQSFPYFSILQDPCKNTRDHNRCLVDSVKSCGEVTSSQYAHMLSAQLPQFCLPLRLSSNSKLLSVLKMLKYPCV